MLDQAIKDQLRPHFADLSATVTLALSASDHPKQAELRELLTEVASCGDRVLFTELPTPTSGVQFDVLRDGKTTGIRFRAVPGQG